MLNGLYPIILVNFSKLLPGTVDQIKQAKIPVVSDIVNKIGLPPIPIYVNEQALGIAIDTEVKSIEIDTTTNTQSDGTTPDITQKGIQSTNKITLLAKKDSIGLMLISALMDVIFTKVTSKEYSISYLNGAVTIFEGKLHSFAVNQQANTDLCEIEMELINPSLVQNSTSVTVPKSTGTVPLQENLSLKGAFP